MENEAALVGGSVQQGRIRLTLKLNNKTIQHKLLMIEGIVHNVFGASSRVDNCDSAPSCSFFPSAIIQTLVCKLQCGLFSPRTCS